MTCTEKDSPYVQRDEIGRHVCPNCYKHYHPPISSKSQTVPGTIQREHFITGICSDACWDAFLGVK